VPSLVAERGNHTRSFDVADFAVPHGREEEWRFTPLERIKPLLDDAAGEGKVEVRIDAPEAVVVEQIDAATARSRTKAVPIDRPSVLAVHHADGARVVRIPAETTLDEPIRIHLKGLGAGTVWKHLLIEAEPFAKATVIIEHSGVADLAGSISIDVADSASLDVVLFQEWDDDASHSGHVAVHLGRDAKARVFAITLGGRTVRLVQTVDYAGPGGDAELYGIYFADDDQHLEHRLFVDHATPHCRSRVTYKGALQGAGAHAVWIGDVLIRAKAVDTDTYELNRNLVLTDGTRVDSVPNLEIETGEIVGAGHASATGRFDDEQLFYLQARGITADEARRLVVRGFFSDIVAEIAVPDLVERIAERLEAELARSGV
jgi:Fe-S cluster assembly protein SufD